MSGQFYRREGGWEGLEKPVRKWSNLNESLKDVYDVRDLKQKRISGVKT